MWVNIKNIMNSVICEYAKKVNENDVAYITIKINDEDHYFLTNQIETEWCIIYERTYWSNTSLNIFFGKSSNLDLSEDNMFSY